MHYKKDKVKVVSLDFLFLCMLQIELTVSFVYEVLSVVFILFDCFAVMFISW